MFCKYCGKENSPESNFCLSCGRNLSSENNAQPVSNIVNNYIPPQHQPLEKPSKKKNGAALITIGWILLGLFLFRTLGTIVSGRFSLISQLDGLSYFLAIIYLLVYFWDVITGTILLIIGYSRKKKASR